MASLQELATYAATRTAILPGALAFSMGARQSLKNFIAVQALGDAPPVDEDDRKRLKRCRVFAATFFMVGILGTEFWLLGQQDEKALDIFFRVLFGFVYQMAFMGTLVDLTKAWSWAAFRGHGRILHFRPATGTVSFPRVLTSFTLATALNVGAYFNVSRTIGSALAVALLYRTVGQAHRKTFSIRVMSLAMLAWLGLVFLLSGIAIAVIVKKYQEDGPGGEADVAKPEDIAFASKSVMDYINLMSPFIYGIVPGMLIAGCYRFDYANHVEENPTVASTITLETVEPSARFARFLSQGVIVPSSVPSRFYKPYFATALRSWLVAQLCVFGLFAVALPLDKAVLDTSAFDFLGLTLAIPFMIVGLGITAGIRGEFKKLWRHREVWTPKEGVEAEGGVVLAEDVEEQLPTYEADEKKALLARETAPAYEVVDVPVEVKA